MLYEVKDEHKEAMECFLSTLSMVDCETDAVDGVAIIIITKERETFTNFQNTSINDLMLMKGYLDVTITRWYLQANYPSVINDDTLVLAEDDEDEV